MGPSPGMALVLSGLTLLGLVAAFANGLPLVVQLPIALLVIGLGSRSILRLLWPDATGLAIDGESIHLRGRSGTRSTGKLDGTPFVSPVYVGIRWRNERRLPRALCVFRGQLSEPDFRKLCAVLRQQGER
ncbi:YgfX family protein [Wenzhouxiangella sp. EGI_FJ10305]|uniref:hypothetical protein n=1 Tax=Wenzhouxiangella sp. EGI_FJ10305 TaxID=3243768 RepID=UPI0035DEEA20